MAYKCDNCHKGAVHGHAVSHAKNRLLRLFKPNLQKLVVFKNGLSVMHVKYCSKCIKKLKKEGNLGIYFLKRIEHKPAKVEVSEKVKAEKINIEKAVKAKKTKELDISAIVGKKS